MEAAAVAVALRSLRACLIVFVTAATQPKLRITWTFHA